MVTNAIDQTGKFGIGIPSGVVLGLGLIVAGLIFRILGKRMAAKTAAGSAVYAQALGFRKYLETAEASQIRFEEASAIFSRYLPYAIVFGVADRWAGTFQKVAEAAAAAGSPLVMPTWYLYSGAMFPDFSSIADGAGSFASSAGGTFAATASQFRFVGRVRVRWRLQRRWWRRGFELGFLVGVGRSTRVSVHAAWPLGRITESVAITTGSGIRPGMRPPRSAGRPRSCTTSRPRCAPGDVRSTQRPRHTPVTRAGSDLRA